MSSSSLSEDRSMLAVGGVTRAFRLGRPMCLFRVENHVPWPVVFVAREVPQVIKLKKTFSLLSLFVPQRKAPEQKLQKVRLGPALIRDGNVTPRCGELVVPTTRPFRLTAFVFDGRPTRVINKHLSARLIKSFAFLPKHIIDEPDEAPYDPPPPKVVDDDDDDGVTEPVERSSTTNEVVVAWNTKRIGDCVQALADLEPPNAEPITAADQLWPGRIVALEVGGKWIYARVDRLSDSSCSFVVKLRPARKSRKTKVYDCDYESRLRVQKQQLP